jgi:esterase/lipase superfamily enzyme
MIENCFGPRPIVAKMSTPLKTLFRASLVLLLAAGGCATQPQGDCPAQTRGSRVAQVFFATDRQPLAAPASEAGPRRFGPLRTSPPALQMGWDGVILGPGHHLSMMDDLELTQAKVEAGSASGHLPLPLERSDQAINAYVGTALRAAIRAAPRIGSRREVLLFVHGFNTDFDYALEKTGQLAGDLGLVSCTGASQGVAVAYSWPSQAAILSYLADEENAEWTQQRLTPFLEALATICQEEGANLQIIAHSMGCRAVVRSLADVARSCPARHSARLLADQVILLAPDISKDLFGQYVERVLPLVGHITIYVSAKDRALAISSILHGGHYRLGFVESTLRATLELTGVTGNNERQLGEVLADTGPSGKIDMIDVTRGLADAIGHTYEDPAFIRDLRELIYHHTPAGTGGRRNLIRKQVRPTLFGLIGKRVGYFQLGHDETSAPAR